MSDLMLIGVLRMPITSQPNELELEQYIQRGRQAADFIEQLQQRNEELEAHVERLREVFNDNVVDLVRCGIGGNYGGKCYDEAMDKYHAPIIDALNATPQQSLNALKREVAYDAWMEGACFIDGGDVLPRGSNGHFENYVEVYLNTIYPTED